MVEKEPDLRDAFGLEVWSKSITRFSTGAVFKPVHAKASTQDGLNPSHVGLDEIHAHKTADLLNVLTSAAGARSNPLWLYTTTEGYTNPGPWGEIRQFAKRLLSGVFTDTADHFLVVFYAVDEENKTLSIEADDEFDESAWAKANPLIDVNTHLLTAIKKEAIEAKQMPSKLAEFRIKRLNRPASTAEGWIDLTKWQKCAYPVDLEFLEDYPCFGGLDLASTTDLTAFRLVWLVDGMTYTHGWRWAPSSAVAYRTERGTVPYASWTETGLIKKTNGDVVDYAVIESDINSICERFNVQSIGYDRWNASDLVNRLVSANLPMIEFIQGPKSYHPAMQALEKAYISGKFAHGNDPVLTWCASNLVARRDNNMNMAPDKKNSADKIDDMTALLMAMGISCANAEKPGMDIQGALDMPLVF
jgi:phage terminase large subunit-like protein